MNLSDVIRNLNHPNQQISLKAKEKVKSFFSTTDIDAPSRDQKELLRKLKRMDCLAARELLDFYEEVKNPKLIFENELLTYVRSSRIQEKDFYEAKLFFQRVFPFFDNTKKLVDCCAGQGLVGIIFALEGKADEVVLVDNQQNNNYQGLLNYAQELTAIKVKYQIGDINVQELPSADLIISVHGCGNLTDKIMDEAIRQSTSFAVMPCCYSENIHLSLSREVDFVRTPDVIDALRLKHALDHNYEAKVRHINPKITPMNRILMGWPR